ncbi:MAG: pyroglutamyl-peptidase I [Pseudolabrys sp.]
MTTLLVTGFGPFPGAPFNPTTPLVKRLARLRRPGLATVRIVGHVFPTSFSAVERELPALIAKYKPDAILMFGLAGRAKRVRIETRARNALALLPDVEGATVHRTKIAPGGPAALVMPAPAMRLLNAAHAARVPAVLSRDAGRYLCNYLSWRAAEAVTVKGGPRLAAFVHVPPVPRIQRPPRPDKPHISQNDLARAGTALLMALGAAARR